MRAQAERNPFQFMKNAMVRSTASLIATVLLAGGALSARAGDAPGDGLAPDQILQKVKENYASLISYSDEGHVVATMNETVTTAFTMRLARANFYLIQWNQSDDQPDAVQTPGTQAVWSSGAGDHSSEGGRVRPQGNQEIALAHAAAGTGGAAAAIPRIFFHLPGGVLDEPGSGLESNNKAQPDEKLGDLDCYVLSSELLGQTNTFWIGKRDFLIHQIRTVVSAGGLQVRSLGAVGGIELIDSAPNSLAFTVTETHTNIVLNQAFSRADFVPAFQTYGTPVP